MWGEKQRERQEDRRTERSPTSPKYFSLSHLNYPSRGPQCCGTENKHLSIKYVHQHSIITITFDGLLSFTSVHLSWWEREREMSISTTCFLPLFDQTSSPRSLVYGMMLQSTEPPGQGRIPRFFAFFLSSQYSYKILPPLWIFCTLFKTFTVYCDHFLANKHSNKIIYSILLFCLKYAI